MRNDMKVLEQEVELKMWCENEKLENYNRRENIRIFGLKEDVRTENGRRIEYSNVTMEKVVNVAKALNAPVNLHDMPIAHSLPTRQEGTERPIIVRFARRFGKVNLKKKKKLRESANLRDVKTYGDLTLPRLRFFNLMRNDPRIENVWTREEVINFRFSYDKRVNKRDSLYEGGKFLRYNVQDVRSCFEVQRNN